MSMYSDAPAGPRFSDAPAAPSVLRLVLLAVGTALIAYLTSLIAGIVGGLTGSAVLGITLRALTAMVVVVLIAWLHAIKWRPASLLPYVAVGLASYALNPLTWAARALFGQLTGNAWLALFLDGAVWVALFVGAVWLRSRVGPPSA